MVSYKAPYLGATLFLLMQIFPHVTPENKGSIQELNVGFSFIYHIANFNTIAFIILN